MLFKCIAVVYHIILHASIIKYKISVVLIIRQNPIAIIRLFVGRTYKLRKKITGADDVSSVRFVHNILVNMESKLSVGGRQV